MKHYPPNYWSTVFATVTRIIDARPSVGGDNAYLAARRIVDEAIQPTLNLEAPCPPCSPSQE